MIDKKKILTILSDFDKFIVTNLVSILRGYESLNPVSEVKIISFLKGKNCNVSVSRLNEYILQADSVEAAQQRAVMGIEDRFSAFLSLLDSLIVEHSKQKILNPFVFQVDMGSKIDRCLSAAILACFNVNDAMTMLENSVANLEIEVRLMVAIFLRKRWNRRFVDIFTKLLDDQEPVMAVIAINALAENGNGESIAKFKQLLYSPSDKIGIAAINALVMLNISDILAQLQLLYSKVHCDRVKASIATALGNLKGKEVVSFLATLLNEPESRVRANSVASLNKIGKSMGGLPESILTKIKNLINDPDHRVKADVIQTLWEMQVSNDIYEIEQMLVSANDVIRSTGAYLCGKLKLTQMAAELENMTSDPSWKVRKMSAISLLSFGTIGRNILTKLLERGNLDQQVIAAYAMGLNSSPEGIELIVARSHSRAEMSDLATKMLMSLTNTSQSQIS